MGFRTKAKLYPKIELGGIAVLYQPIDISELDVKELWHIYVPSRLESEAKAYLYDLTYKRKKDCLRDFFEMLMNLARDGKLNLHQLESLEGLMKEIDKETFKEWIEEVDRLHEKLIDEIEETEVLYKKLGGRKLTDREKQLIGAVLDLQRMEGENLRHRFVVEEE